MRVFAALPLPPCAAGLLAETLPGLRSACPNLKIVSADGLHVTLHFFGELGEDAVAAVLRAMEEPRLSRPPIAASLGGLGFFPPAGNPHVVFRRVETGHADVAACRQAFLSAIAPLGHRPEGRPFDAHVTLARNRGGPVDLRDAAAPEPLEFSFEEIVLFRSILERSGARYEALQRIPLREVTP